MIKVSIVVPVYKAEKYLSKCVESLVSQTLSEIEIILVNDGSPDNSGKVCDELAETDSRIKVIHKENGGVSSARNCGIEEALGEYILFVDSDDWVEKDYAQTLYECKERFPSSQVICGFRTVSDYSGTLIANWLFESEGETVLPLSRYMDLVDAWLAQSPCNKLFSKKIIDKGNIRFEETLSLGEDMIFDIEYYQLCGNCDIICINRPLYNYIRTEKESLDNKYYPDLLEIDEKIYSKLEKAIISWGADDEQLQKYINSRFYRYVTALSNTYRLGNKASSREKRKTNGKILKSDEFKSALSKVTSRIHPIHKIAYKSGSWTIVRIAYKITSLKKLLRKK